MEDVDVAVCGVCFRENDSTGQPLVNWVQCEMCYVWYHELCVTITEPDDSCTSTFMCDCCFKS